MSSENPQKSAASKYINIFDPEWISADGIKDIFSEQTNTSSLYSVDKLQEILEIGADQDGAQDLDRAEVQLIKSIKERQNQSEVFESMFIRDFSIQNRKSDRDEDYLYAQGATAEKWLNVKDGNAILEVYSGDNYEKLSKVSIARQGLPKIYPLRFDFVGPLSRFQTHKNRALSSIQHQILAPVKKALLQGHSIEIVRLLKTNGDNAQISWNADFNVWVIASRKVTLIAENIAQLYKHYPEESRYIVARKIAIAWFNMLEKIEAMGMGKLEALKADMTNRTFVGELVGNPELVNLVRYSKETIIFHSVVENSRHAQSPAYCLANCHRILKRHGLDITPILSLGPFTTYDEVCDQLVEEFQSASCSSISIGEEGSVLQFNQLDQSSAEETPNPTRASSNCKVISMCKIKSFEYKALQLIEQTLVRVINMPVYQLKYDKMIYQVIRDLKFISKGVDNKRLPHKNEFYVGLFSTAFFLVTKDKNKEHNQNLLLNNLFKFFTVVIDANEARNQGKQYVGQIDFNSKLFSDDPFMQLTPEPIITPKPDFKSEQKVKKVAQEKPQKKERVRQERPQKKEQANVAQSASVRNVTLLVLLPLALSNKSFEKIKGHYTLTEVTKFNVASLPESSGKHLVIATSLEGIVEQSKLCNLKLFVFDFANLSGDDFVKKFYVDKHKYYIPAPLKDSLSALSIRHEFKKQSMLINENILLSIGNPANIFIKTEEELLIVLGLQDPVITETVDLQKQIEPEKGEIFKKELENITPIQPGEKIQAKQIQKKVEQKKQIIVILPIGIPGMGKTSFVKNSLKPCLSTLNRPSNLHLLSNDQTRKVCLDEWLKDNPKGSVAMALQQSAPAATVLFQQNLSETLTKAAAPSVKKELQVIYLDKNYPPAEINATINAIDSHEANQIANISKVALVPDIENPYQDSPFSLTFFVQCYIRCLDRSGHLTLSNEDPERLAKILILFFKQFENITLDKQLLKTYGFNQLLTVPFTVEHKELELPQKLEAAVTKAIFNFQAESAIPEFVRLISLYRVLFGARNHKATKSDHDQLGQDLEAIAAQITVKKEPVVEKDDSVNEQDNDDTEEEPRPKKVPVKTQKPDKIQKRRRNRNH